MRSKTKIKKPTINEALRLARLYWGYTQAEMADRTGVSQPMISSIEAGSKAVSMELLERYASGLNVRMSNLMFFAEELKDKPLHSRGKLLVGDKVLELLDAFAPKEKKASD
jgi:transcriptional regulator with XRE-family HTH domain